MAKPELSVIIPAYNEETVIGQTIQEVSHYLTACAITHEILVVDDGSSDHTVARVRELMPHGASLRMLQANHQGKGAAVKAGVLAAEGAHMLFMDADHSTHIREWEKCSPWLRNGYDVVIGSRKMPGANVTVHQPLLRELMGKVFTRLTNVVLGIRVSDVTCGFKCFTAEAARNIFRRSRMKAWSFDAEILFIARHRGYRIQEVPVVWADDASTKVRLASDTLRSLSELFQIRLSAWSGCYRDRQ